MNHTVKPTVLSIIPSALDFLFGCVIWPLQYPSLANRAEALGRRCWRTFGVLCQEHGELLTPASLTPTALAAWVTHSCHLLLLRMSQIHPSFQAPQPYSLPLLVPGTSLSCLASYSPHSSYGGLCQCRSGHKALLSCLNPSMAPHYPKDED